MTEDERTAQVIELAKELERPALLEPEEIQRIVLSAGRSNTVVNTAELDAVIAWAEGVRADGVLLQLLLTGAIEIALGGHPGQFSFRIAGKYPPWRRELHDEVIGIADAIPEGTS